MGAFCVFEVNGFFVVASIRVLSLRSDQISYWKAFLAAVSDNKISLFVAYL